MNLALNVQAETSKPQFGLLLRALHSMKPMIIV